MAGKSSFSVGRFPGARGSDRQSRYNGDLFDFIHFDILVTLHNNWQSLMMTGAT